MTAPTTLPTTAVQKLTRAHYLAALLAAVAALIRQAPGEHTVEGVLAVQERDLRELADLVGELRRDWGA